MLYWATMGNLIPSLHKKPPKNVCVDINPDVPEIISSILYLAV